MKIESIAFSAFASLTSGIGAIADSARDGCAWYATSDARAFGYVHFRPSDCLFGFSVLYLVMSAWYDEKSDNTFDLFDEAEAALLTAMRLAWGRKCVTVHDVPMRLRFGRGRNRTPTGDAKAY